MQTPVLNLRVKEETSSSLHLQTSNRRWLAFFGVLLVMTLPVLFSVGIMLIEGEGNQMIGAVMLAVVLSFAGAIWLFTAFRSELLIQVDAQRILLTNEYWLGIGSLKRKREKSWNFTDVTDISISSARNVTRVVVKTKDKKDLACGFSFKTKEDGQRLYDRLKSWVEGVSPQEFDIDEMLMQSDDVS